MILLRLLDHDLHRTRQSIQAIPLWIETPARPGFVPAVISRSTMEDPETGFLVSRRLTQDGKLRSGVFKYDSDRIDDIIGGLVLAAYKLSLEEKWPNIFRGKSQLKQAFEYVQRAGGMKSQPHMCLVPEGQEVSKFNKAAGKDLKEGVYRKVCRVVPCKVAFPVFCSRPDFVGMYTQFVGGRSSIILHNVRNGLSFCPPDAN
jgi:hypothetical protein